MKILHLTPKDYTTGTWSGGSTTELFIWPEGASYAARQFAIRISSARVDLDESDFTALPGVQRYILPLSGSFTLTHPGQRPVTLAPMDRPYSFSGELPTHCVGRATDFNLMLQGVRGEMTLAAGETAVKPGFHGFFAVRKDEFVLNGTVYPMEPGDFLAVFADAPMQISLGPTPTPACWVEI